MKCPNCERAELVEHRENYQYNECGLSSVTLVALVVRKCPDCGNVMPRIPNIEGLHDAITHALINKSERLLPQEIVFLRKYLGWSGADFARNMHCDRAQISKWEHGRVEMSKPYELLLREMVASGKKIEDYHRHEAAREKVFKASSLKLQLMEKSWKEAA
ncbi:MAG TPA: type II TA system antitoxin MqsA family protein [Geobacterales bacterium]|nr:type II TA system antitoxin MqsA family protein [Geobacterales bacterium]